MRWISREEMDRIGDWRALVEALRNGHLKAKPQLNDWLVRDGNNAWLTRSAWMPGGDLGLKSVTVFPGNKDLDPPIASINGAFLLYNAQTGVLDAVLDGAGITDWKTAADSALGASLLARRDAARYLVCGAGAVASRLPFAMLAIRPELERVVIWNRSAAGAERLCETLSPLLPVPCEVAHDLAEAVAEADIVSTATMATEPFLRGEWLKPGCHVDLIGAYRPDMREADDAVLKRCRLFVDCRETTLDEIGEMLIPIRQGTISKDDVLGDYYDLCAGRKGRTGDEDITLLKNGGGAHLDLMTASYFLDRAQDRTAAGHRGSQ